MLDEAFNLISADKVPISDLHDIFICIYFYIYVSTIHLE